MMGAAIMSLPNRALIFLVVEPHDAEILCPAISYHISMFHTQIGGSTHVHIDTCMVTGTLQYGVAFYLIVAGFGKQVPNLHIWMLCGPIEF